MLESYLRQLMAEHKINDISELMEATGISRNSINKLFKEVDMETLKLETLIQICHTFNIRLSDLIQYTPDSFVNHDAIRVEELKRELTELFDGVKQLKQRLAPRNSGARRVGSNTRQEQIAEESSNYKKDNGKSDNS